MNVTITHLRHTKVFLPEQARYRIGLSATPEHYLDEERNDRLAEFYGEIVCRYTLRQAIEDKILTPYTYYPHIVTLSETEAEEFVELSEKIGPYLGPPGEYPGGRPRHAAQGVVDAARRDLWAPQ